MTVLLIIVAVVVAIVVVKAICKAPAPEVDPERLMEVAVELHAIRRRLDVAWARSELRHESAQLRRDLQDELNDVGGRG